MSTLLPTVYVALCREYLSWVSNMYFQLELILLYSNLDELLATKVSTIYLMFITYDDDAMEIQMNGWPSACLMI